MNNYFIFDLKHKEKEEELKKRVQGLLITADLGDCDKTDIEEYYQKVSHRVHEYQIEVRNLKDILHSWESERKSAISSLKIIESKFTTKAELLKALECAENELNEWMKLGDELDELRRKNKNFNKSICFSNIRELLKENSKVKIGQIEREAGIRLGYMSRLEKEDNTSEPSMEFIVTAAKLLNVSVDTLISYDLAGLSSTEKYLVNFIEKLKTDTINEKLNWDVESKFELNKAETDINGNCLHPLFSLEEFYRQTDCEYPQQVTDYVYVSKTFGPNTCINDDCFKLRLKNGSTFYLMDIVKDVHRTNDKSAYVKEAVMYVPGGKNQVLATSKDNYPIGELLNNLYDIVKENTKHPKVNKDAMYAIDAFMRDDLSDDEEILPF